jgi:hypothetical protein
MSAPPRHPTRRDQPRHVRATLLRDLVAAVALAATAAAVVTALILSIAGEAR